MSTCTTDEYGNKIWYNSNNQLHREDGPAVKGADGYKAWYLNGKLHREDGPTVEYPDGTKEWFLDNKQYTEEEYKKEMRKRNYMPPEPLPQYKVDNIHDCLKMEYIWAYPNKK